MESPPGRIEFERPPWLLDAVITTKEAAALLDTNHETLRHWLKVARLMGIPLHSKAKSKPRINGHHIYIIAILASLHNAGIDCSPELIRAAHATAHDHNVPRLPHLFETVVLNERDAAGKPIAMIVVEIGQLWLELQTKVEALLSEAGT